MKIWCSIFVYAEKEIVYVMSIGGDLLEKGGGWSMGLEQRNGILSSKSVGYAFSQ
jgi:hypothetical protein